MNNLPQKFYISTAIDYVNGKPHIGHAYEKVASDVLARFYRARGVDTFFLTGTDEHGAKNAEYASASGLSVEDYVAQTSAYFSFAWDSLQISYNRFIRTTDADHVKTVEEIFQKIKDNGYLYESDYEGLYCTGHEAFVTEKDLANGLCPEHQKAPEKIKEKNWFFKTAAFTQEIQKKIERDEFKIWPQARRQEILSLLKQGFNDIAVTRPNVKWGIPVPWDRQQTIYVWVDALINYVSGAGFSADKSSFKKYWPADCHVIGKDIIKFHCIIWPALLLAAGLELPRSVLVHGYLTVNNQKIGKSLGNAIDPGDWVAQYGSDAVRYFLLREVPFNQDGDVSEEKLRARYQGDLANGLGNLVSRVTTLVENFLGGDINYWHESAVFSPSLSEGRPARLLARLWRSGGWRSGGGGERLSASDEVDRLILEFKFHEALAKIWERVAWANKTVDENKLWELGKTDLKKFTRIAAELLTAIQIIGREIAPFMPETSQKILKHLNRNKITKIAQLFPRVIS